MFDFYTTDDMLVMYYSLVDNIEQNDKFLNLHLK